MQSWSLGTAERRRCIHDHLPRHRLVEKEENNVDKMLLTPEEAAQALSIGRSKLYELLRAGALGSVRIGGSRRIPVAALQAYVVELGTKKRQSAA